ncbi:PAS domain S-box protein [Hansschlegelia quercus]|uniref:histidine kinase n=1 Tax=Hansschlegelia quercus TaxID=2528245 RepID=A0A4Q9GJM9_9HYPH|nr:PAS domain-containing sensor histidine kinase [Hansschlegelia quercus]TBN51792.1 PAS domain-containing sensor histidine kinase [Hansschlegelia quercus]
MTSDTDKKDVLGADEGRFRLLVDSVLDYAIFMLEADGTVATWNRGAERFKGYSEAEIVGRHFSTFYTDEDRADGLPERALRTARTEGRFEQEGWRVRKDGSRMWAHVVIDPILGAGGDLLGYAKITRDLTERRSAQEALGRSEDRFEILVQGVRDYAIYMLDRDGRVTNWNTGAHHLKGYTEEEIVGQHFSRFYTDEDRGVGLPVRALRIAAEEGRFEQEGWRVRKNGTRFWAHVIVDAIRNEAGELIGYAKVTRDLTEKREAQIALEQTRAALAQAQKMEAIGQLTGGVAHDFNNLLAVILGNLDLARKRLSRGSGEIAALIENSIDAARRGASLTQRMLAFARRQDLKSEAIDVPQLVHGMAHLLEHSVGPSIQIETQFPLELPAARADSNQLELVILNLVINARDAMPDGGSITLSAREETVAAADGPVAAGSYVALVVKDTGHGMDAGTLERAAEPFFTTKGVGRGTGLGLSMIHGFAEQSGGRLVLKSAPGEGTSAEIWLPASSTAPVTASDAGDHESSSETTVDRLTILVVDDDGLVLTNTATMLEDLGHDVLEAASGEEALHIFRQSNSIDLVITDQVMPGITGAELARKIHTINPRLAVVLASGFVELPEQLELNLPRLNKPFMQADLAKVIAALFSSSAGRRVANAIE